MPNDRSLIQLNRDRHEGKTTTREICRKVLGRIEEHEPQIGAFITQTPERAKESAEIADEAIRSGREVGILEGMPLAVKDLFVTRGVKTTCGSRLLSNFIPPYESTPTAKLLEKKYGLVGKTNLDEFGMGSSTENSGYKITRNPVNPEKVAGGSSGGSAAAVSAGFCLGSLGTDTGGSIRQPAGFCGVVGVKPTYGRVSRHGVVAYGSSLDQAGVFANDVADAALLLEAICGYDDHDNTSLNVSAPDFGPCFGKDAKGMKIGLIKNLDLGACERDVENRFHESLDLFREGGAEIKEIDLPNLEHGIATYYILVASEASSNLGRFDGIRYGVRAEADNLQDVYSKSRDAGFGDEVKLRILIGTFALSSGYYDAYYLKAMKVRSLIRSNFRKAFAEVDVIALPVAPTTAFGLGENRDNPLKMYLGDVFTVPANLAGLPGISFPAGTDSEGLPIGMQLLAPHLCEDRLFRAADWFEKNSGFAPAPAPFST